VVRAARLNAKLAIAIIGGDPARFAPFSDLYRTAMKEFGHEMQPISIHSPGHISDSDEQAIEELWPHYEVMFGRIGRERARWLTQSNQWECSALTSSIPMAPWRIASS
jgi:hypothetical protein